jgi:hypothetical protein
MKKGQPQTCAVDRRILPTGQEEDDEEIEKFKADGIFNMNGMGFRKSMLEGNEEDCNETPETDEEGSNKPRSIPVAVRSLRQSERKEYFLNRSGKGGKDQLKVNNLGYYQEKKRVVVEKEISAKAKLAELEKVKEKLESKRKEVAEKEEAEEENEMDVEAAEESASPISTPFPTRDSSSSTAGIAARLAQFAAGVEQSRQEGDSISSDGIQDVDGDLVANLFSDDDDSSSDNDSSDDGGEDESNADESGDKPTNFDAARYFDLVLSGLDKDHNLTRISAEQHKNLMQHPRSEKEVKKLKGLKAGFLALFNASKRQIEKRIQKKIHQKFACDSAGIPLSDEFNQRRVEVQTKEMISGLISKHTMTGKTNIVTKSCGDGWHSQKRGLEITGDEIRERKDREQQLMKTANCDGNGDKLFPDTISDQVAKKEAEDKLKCRTPLRDLQYASVEDQTISWYGSGSTMQACTTVKPQNVMTFPRTTGVVDNNYGLSEGGKSADQLIADGKKRTVDERMKAERKTDYLEDNNDADVPTDVSTGSDDGASSSENNVSS